MMSKREIASLAIKLMGVFILLKGISYVPYMISNIATAARLPSGGWIGDAAWAVFLAAIPLAWALVVIIFSGKIAEWLIKSDDDKPIQAQSAITKDDVMLVAFTCIGLYLIVVGFPDLIIRISQFLIVNRAGGGYYADSTGRAYRLMLLLAPVAQIAIGIWLFAGSNGIVKLWHKIRS